MSLNSITVTGTLKKDPEKRFTPTNIPVTNLTLEVTYVPRGSQSQSGENIASQIIRVNAWRDLAEECERKLKAGHKILVIGRAQLNAYTNNEGKKKREIEIDAQSITLLEDVMAIVPPVSSEKGTSEKSEKTQTFKKSSPEAEQVSNFDEVVANTEEIPF